MKLSNTPHTLRFAFFGTPEFATIILDELKASRFLPSVVITAPDAPKGRKLIMTPSEVKTWATARNIPVLTPATLKDTQFTEELQTFDCALFIVAAYGKIIPPNIVQMPPKGVLNVHPSLLPKFRGSSPIESAIRSDETHTGVTIMLLDEELDHGPIIAQKYYAHTVWPPKGSVLTRDLAHLGGKLLAEIIPKWMDQEIMGAPQDHIQATFTKKITKSDGLIDLAGDPLTNYKKIRAYDHAHFFTEQSGKRIRVKITDATYEDGALTITRVIPEGKKEMAYSDFLRGHRETD